MTTLLNIQPKQFRRSTVLRTNDDGTFNANVHHQHGFIRIFGEFTNRITPKTFDRTFSIGDEAEYDGYNLRYVGSIVAIGPNTVTIKHYPDSKTVTRLDLCEFIRRNWNFDAARIEKHNVEEMQCI